VVVGPGIDLQLDTFQETLFQIYFYTDSCRSEKAHVLFPIRVCIYYLPSVFPISFDVSGSQKIIGKKGRLTQSRMADRTSYGSNDRDQCFRQRPFTPMNCSPLKTLFLESEFPKRKE